MAAILSEAKDLCILVRPKDLSATAEILRFAQDDTSQLSSDGQTPILRARQNSAAAPRPTWFAVNKPGRVSAVLRRRYSSEKMRFERKW